MTINSRRKGAEGERQLAHVLEEYGYKTRRSVQYNGKDGQADVIGLPNIHVEVKRVEKLNIYDAINQAKRDAKNGDIPTVFHRKNRCNWLVTMELNEFMTFYECFMRCKRLNEYIENNGG